jgi:hypothetical protein
MPCKGLTAKGLPCRNRMKDENKLYCFMHEPERILQHVRAYPQPNRVEESSLPTDSDSMASEQEFETDSNDSEELAMFYVMNRINSLREENDQLQIKVRNQRQAVTDLHKSHSKIKMDYAEFRRQTILKELQQEEQYKELSNIIQELTNQTKHYKKQLLVSEINAECYKELLKCEQFFDVLKKIRNKVCPYLADKRFHVENFIKNPKCMDTARKMLNMDGEELRSQYLEYKATRNRLAHPIFETDINDQVISMI